MSQSTYTPSKDLTTKLKENGNLATNADTVTYTLFDLEKRVIEALNTFNEKYAIYLRCSSGIYNENALNYNVVYPTKTGCQGKPTDKEVNKTAATTAYDTLKIRVEALNTGLSNLHSTGGITNEEYQAKYNEILSKHRDILRTRSEMDEKIKDIMAVDNVDKRGDRPRISDVFVYHDTTVYSSMMLTVLATSLIYYAFVKM